MNFHNLHPETACRRVVGWTKFCSIINVFKASTSGKPAYLAYQYQRFGSIPWHINEKRNVVSWRRERLSERFSCLLLSLCNHLTIKLFVRRAVWRTSLWLQKKVKSVGRLRSTCWWPVNDASPSSIRKKTTAWLVLREMARVRGGDGWSWWRQMPQNKTWNSCVRRVAITQMDHWKLYTENRNDLGGSCMCILLSRILSIL